MKTKRSMIIQYILISLLVISLTGCRSTIPQTKEPPVVNEIPLAISPETNNSMSPTIVQADNSLMPDLNLEPITANNIERLSLTARFSEGSFSDHLAYTQDGKLLAIAAGGGIVFHDAGNGERIDFFPEDNFVVDLSFSPDSKSLAYISLIPSGEKYSDADPDFAGQEILKPQLTLRSLSDGTSLYSVPMAGKGCGEYRASELEFSPDGKRILFLDDFGWPGLPSSGSLCVLDATNGNLLRVIKPEDPLRMGSLTTTYLNGTSVWTSLVAYSETPGVGIIHNEIRQYNLDDGTLISKIDVPESGELLLSPDQQWLVEMNMNVVQIRSSADGHLVSEIHPDQEDDNNPYSAVTFSPDGQTLAVGEWDGSVSLYSFPQGQLQKTLEPITIKTILAKPEPLHVINLHFSPDGSVLYILINSFADTQIIARAVNMDDGNEFFRISGRDSLDQYPSLSADCSLLAWGGYVDGSVEVWSTLTGKMVHELKGHSLTVLQTGFSPDGRQLATASMDGTLGIWDMTNGKNLNTINAHEGGVWAVAYLPDGSRLVSVGMDGQLKIWNPADGSLLKKMDSGTSGWQVNSIIPSKDGHSVLIASGCIYMLNCMAGGAGDLRRIDLDNGETTILTNESAYSLSLSSDQTSFGGTFYGKHTFGQISSAEVRVLQEYTSPFGNGALEGSVISPDGKLFISGNSNGMHVWDTNNNQMIALLQDPSQAGEYGTFQFSQGGRILMVAGGDGVIYLWGVRK